MKLQSSCVKAVKSSRVVLTTWLHHRSLVSSTIMETGNDMDELPSKILLFCALRIGHTLVMLSSICHIV